MSTAVTFIPAQHPLVQIEGRHLVTAESSVRLGFPGVRLRLKVRGHALAMRVLADNEEVYFDLRVNGGEAARLRLAKGLGDYPVLAEKGEGPHDLEITRRNESWQGTCEIFGFVTGNASELEQAPDPQGPRLMFIGDSITCGEKTEYRIDDPLLESSPAKVCSANARLAYGMLIAETLKARCHLVSYGGRGILRDWQGLRTVANAPQFYELCHPDIPSHPWDPARYVPDVIGVGLGTNDFNQGIPDQNDFVNTYVEFVRKLRRDAPKASIILIESPIVRDDQVNGPRRSVLRHYLEEIRRKAGDPKLSIALLGSYAGIPGDGHPSGTEHKAIALELLPYFRLALT